jgi:hypothetical protein
MNINNNNNGLRTVPVASSSSFLTNSSSSVSQSLVDVSAASHNNKQPQQQDLRFKFELPSNIADDDIVLVENILSAVQSLGTEDSPLCVKYKVKVVANGYILGACLPSADVFEIDLDDLLFVKSISPSRIDSVCIAKNTAQGSTELLVKILDHKQRIMITRSTSFSATRKRKFNSIV